MLKVWVFEGRPSPVIVGVPVKEVVSVLVILLDTLEELVIELVFVEVIVLEEVAVLVVRHSSTGR